MRLLRSLGSRLRPLPMHRCLYGVHGVSNDLNVKKLSEKTTKGSHKRVLSTSLSSSIFQLLSHDESSLLAEQRALTERASNIAAKLPSITSNLAKKSLLPEAPFSIVIMGEFNAGKSTLLNALLGAHVLDTGPLPTTDCLTVLLHGDKESITNHGNTLHYTSPHIPPDVVFVDTPGTNAVVLNHTLTTLELLPSADLIFFCTSADRPFTQSERDLLQQMQHYRKSIVVVINKMDILDPAGGNHGDHAKQRVVDFVTEHAADLLGARPVVLPVSARDALVCKVNGSTRSAMYDRSQFGTLETYLQSHLTEDTKITSKLLTPVGVVQGVVSECLALLQEQRKELQTDSATLSLLRAQCVSWRNDLQADLIAFQSDIRSVLHQEGNRGQKLIQRTSSLTLLRWSLLDKDRLQAEWNKLERPRTKELHQRLDEIATLLNTRARAQSQAVVEYLGKRPSIKADSLVGSVSARLADSSFLPQLGSAVDSILVDHGTPLPILHQRAMLTAACQIVAVAGGMTALMNELDPTTSLSLVAAASASGGVAMHTGRAAFVQSYQQTWDDMGGDLDEALRAICDKELARCNAAIMDGVSPYTRYVESEQRRLNTLTNESEDVLATAQTLRNRILKLRK
jgi:small GTP-binding protein